MVEDIELLSASVRLVAQLLYLVSAVATVRPLVRELTRRRRRRQK